MSLQGCTSGLAVTAVVAVVLLVPTHYYVPSARPPAPMVKIPALSLDVPASVVASSVSVYDEVPADVVLAATFVCATLMVYLCEWIQRKLMQRRIDKMNERLSASVAHLQQWEGRQARLKSSLRAVRAATAEYNLLLHLLLRQHRTAPTAAPARDNFEHIEVQEI